MNESEELFLHNADIENSEEEEQMNSDEQADVVSIHVAKTYSNKKTSKLALLDVKCVDTEMVDEMFLQKYAIDTEIEPEYEKRWMNKTVAKEENLRIISDANALLSMYESPVKITKSRCSAC